MPFEIRRAPVPQTFPGVHSGQNPYDNPAGATRALQDEQRIRYWYYSDLAHAGHEVSPPPSWPWPCSGTWQGVEPWHGWHPQSALCARFFVELAPDAASVLPLIVEGPVETP
ncbi:unnamed protein product [Prorocentrum cordatum]|uniref:Uncharacterized protein n=1 Tax=Prorocentrum cordatum TaxID=2364126 RepID=A0ABN9WXG5_9DINO|nr:unnamed protein product [Polarella glacialis]